MLGGKYQFRVFLKTYCGAVNAPDKLPGSTALVDDVHFRINNLRIFGCKEKLRCGQGMDFNGAGFRSYMHATGRTLRNERNPVGTRLVER